MADEDPQARVRSELLLDPAVAAAADLAVIEVGLGRVDRDDGDRADAEHGVAVAEQLLEMDVADVPRVVVARDHDHRLALDLVEVAPRLLVLVLEAERGQVAGAHDDVGLQIVDLADRALEQAGNEVLAAAMEVGEMRDREARTLGRRTCGKHRSAILGSEATLQGSWRGRGLCPCLAQSNGGRPGRALP